MQAVGPARDTLDACLIFPSMPAVMKLNKLGTFSMSQARGSGDVGTCRADGRAKRERDWQRLARAGCCGNTAGGSRWQMRPPTPHPHPHPTPAPQLGQGKSAIGEFMRNARKNNDNFEEQLLKLVGNDWGNRIFWGGGRGGAGNSGMVRQEAGVGLAARQTH